MVKIPPSEITTTQPQIQEATQVPGKSEQTNGLPAPTPMKDEDLAKEIDSIELSA